MRLPADCVEASVVELVKHLEISQAIDRKVEECDRKCDSSSFFLCDLGDVVDKYRRWTTLLPRVQSYYAIGCNDDTAVLTVLSQLGANFSCANKTEIQRVEDLHIAMSRVEFSNPCKQSTHIKFAERVGVNLLAFDNESELRKIKSQHPHAQLLMQVLTPGDSSVEDHLGLESGCSVKNSRHLLQSAKRLGLNVVGVSAQICGHVHCADTVVDLVACLRAVFDVAQDEGFNISIVDVGDFSSNTSSDDCFMEELCSQLRRALDAYFPTSLPDVRIVSELSRFFVSSAFNLVVNILEKECDSIHAINNLGEVILSDDPTVVYYLSEGIYGAFSRKLCEDISIHPTLIGAERYLDRPCFSSVLMGPTCDTLDCIVPHCTLPALYPGDWITFRDMGAYTHGSTGHINCHYTMQETQWFALCCSTINLLSYNTNPRLNVSLQDSGDRGRPHSELTGHEEWLDI